MVCVNNDKHKEREVTVQFEKLMQYKKEEADRWWATTIPYKKKIIFLKNPNTLLEDRQK